MIEFQVLKPKVVICLVFVVHTSHLLLINEVYFGPNGFLELLDENTEALVDDTTKPYENQNMIIAKRLKNGRNIYIDAVVDLSNMVKTLDDFILIQTSNQQSVTSSLTNTLISPGNTRFSLNIDNDNLLAMDETTLMLVFLVSGPLPTEIFPTGQQRRVTLDEALIEKLIPITKDFLIFGGINSISPTKIVKYLKQNSFLPETKIPRKYLNTGAHSFSRCSETTSPFLSNTFKDTSPRDVTTQISEILLQIGHFVQIRNFLIIVVYICYTYL